MYLIRPVPSLAYHQISPRGLLHRKCHLECIRGSFVCPGRTESHLSKTCSIVFLYVFKSIHFQTHLSVKNNSAKGSSQSWKKWLTGVITFGTPDFQQLFLISQTNHYCFWIAFLYVSISCYAKQSSVILWKYMYWLKRYWRTKTFCKGYFAFVKYEEN